MRHSHTRWYLLAAALLVVIRVFFPEDAWSGDRDLDTLTHVAAALLAFGVGLMGSVHFHGRQETHCFLVVAGFVGAGCLDALHAAGSSAWAEQLFTTSSPAHRAAWCSCAALLFMAVVVFLSWLIGPRSSSRPAWIREKNAWLLIIGVTLPSVLFLASFDLPEATGPAAGSVKFLTAALALAALVGYLNRGAWKHDAFEHWLVLALIVGLLGQVLFSYGAQAFDTLFTMASFWKMTSYFCVLIGILISQYQLQQLAVHSTDELETKVAELDQANRFLDTIVENIPNMIFVKEADELRFVRFNRAGEELLGFARDDLIGKNDYDFFPAEEADFFTEKDREVFKSKEGLDIPDEPIHTRSKGRRILHTKKVPLFTREGHPQYLLGISEDITEKIRIEERLRETNRDLEGFAYVCSHDLKAPLRAIDNLSQWIDEDAADALSGDARVHLDMLRERVRHMSRLIDDLLRYSRVGQDTYTLEHVDVRGLIEETLTLIQPTDPYTIEFVGDFPTLTTYRPPLEQIYINLIGNAFKHHNDPASIKIILGCQRVEDMWEFSVADNGPGIPREFQRKAFQMFQAFKASERQAGSGLGLAIVDKLVRKHGGTLVLESAENRGATFRFTWPDGGHAP